MKRVKVCVGCNIERNAWYSDSGNFRILDCRGLGYIREWFTKELFDFSFVDCLGGFLLRLFMTIIGLLFTPGVIVCFFFRWLFALPIKRGGKDNE